MKRENVVARFETLLILGLVSGAIYYFVIGEPWVALGSLAVMQWIRIN